MSISFENQEKKIKWILIGIVFTVLFMICTYKLTNASLWFDETVEYYYSTTLTGGVEGSVHHDDPTVDSMYDRIITTYQPPLYNVVMFFWLLINGGEWWFRFFGVVMGMLTGVAIYKTITKLWNYKAALIAVLILSCTKQFIYYVQECAEYNLLIAALAWTIYFWVCVMEDTSIKNIVKFIIGLCACVYSQYGAIFPVAAFGIVTFVYVMLKAEKQEKINLFIGYIAAGIVAAFPLWFFFLRKQMELQQSSSSHNFKIVDGIFTDVYNAFVQTINWVFGCDNHFFIVLAILCLFFCLIFSKNLVIKTLILSNILCWCLFYVAVRFNFYSYGSFSGRYLLFYIPIWLITLFVLVKEIFIWVKKANVLDAIHMGQYRSELVCGVLLAVVGGYCLLGWNSIQPNWSKEDIRGATAKWYELKGYEIETLVYHGAGTGFRYYLEHDERYNETMRESITYMGWLRNKTVEEFATYFDDVYNGNFPSEMYIIASHIVGDLDEIQTSFTDRGYVATVEYNKAGGQLIHLKME